ncbi:MAG TPA: hypothetical protein ENN69_02980 [Spirochaetia bacterium]|nr:hypothetical protein [Spirochaetia bacterium]
MRDRMNCGRFRLMLEESHERGRGAAGELERHLEACASCRAYRDFLRSFKEDVSKALDAAWSTPAAVDYPALGILKKKRCAKRRRVSLLFAAAATVALGGGGLIALHGVSLAREQQLVREETSTFVENLFAEPLFDGLEYPIEKDAAP